MGCDSHCFRFHVHKPRILLHDRACIRPTSHAVWHHKLGRYRVDNVHIRPRIRYVNHPRTEMCLVLTGMPSLWPAFPWPAQRNIWTFTCSAISQPVVSR